MINLIKNCRLWKWLEFDYEPIQYYQNPNHPLITGCASQHLRSSVPSAGCEVACGDALDNPHVRWQETITLEALAFSQQSQQAETCLQRSWWCWIPRMTAEKSLQHAFCSGFPSFFCPTGNDTAATTVVGCSEQPLGWHRRYRHVCCFFMISEHQSRSWARFHCPFVRMLSRQCVNDWLGDGSGPPAMGLLSAGMRIFRLVLTEISSRNWGTVNSQQSVGSRPFAPDLDDLETSWNHLILIASARSARSCFKEAWTRNWYLGLGSLQTGPLSAVHKHCDCSIFAGPATWPRYCISESGEKDILPMGATSKSRLSELPV